MEEGEGGGEEGGGRGGRERGAGSEIVEWLVELVSKGEVGEGRREVIDRLVERVALKGEMEEGWGGGQLVD